MRLAPTPPAELVERLQPQLRTVRIDRRSLVFLDVGRGPTVLLIHGLGQTWHGWAAIVEDLARDHRVIAVDLPGSGLSDRLPWSRDLAPYAAGLVELLELLGATPALVVGHSMGGIIGQRVALQLGSRCTGLLLSASAGMAIPRMRLDAISCGLTLVRAIFYTRCATRAIWRVKPLRDAVIAGFVADPAALSADYALLLCGGYRGPGYWRALHAARGDQIRLRIAALSVPTILVWGDRDPLIPPALSRDLAASIDGAETHEWAGVKHAPHLERPPEFNDLIRTLGKSRQARNSPSSRLA